MAKGLDNRVVCGSEASRSRAIWSALPVASNGRDGRLHPPESPNLTVLYAQERRQHLELDRVIVHRHARGWARKGDGQGSSCCHDHSDPGGPRRGARRLTPRQSVGQVVPCTIGLRLVGYEFLDHLSGSVEVVVLSSGLRPSLRSPLAEATQRWGTSLSLRRIHDIYIWYGKLTCGVLARHRWLRARIRIFDAPHPASDFCLNMQPGHAFTIVNTSFVFDNFCPNMVSKTKERGSFAEGVSGGLAWNAHSFRETPES